MRNLIIILCSIFLISCGSVKSIPIETKVFYNYIDSTVIKYKDSIIFVEIPVEKIVDVVAQYDTSKLESSVAKSTAYVDTATHTLKHSLINKDSSLKKDIKVEYIDRIVYKDSIIIRHVPVEVPIDKIVYPKIFW